MAVEAPASIADAQAELERVMGFLNAVQGQIQQAHARAGFLSGWLSAKGVDLQTGEVVPLED